MIIFNKGKKYRFGSNSVIDWVYVGKCTNGSAYDTFTFVNREQWTRKQYKRNELKDLNIFLNEN